METTSAVAITLTVFIVGGGLFFLPAIIALSRRHRGKMAILVLNFILLIAAPFLFPIVFSAWLVALIWSFSGNVPEQHEHEHLHMYVPPR